MSRWSKQDEKPFTIADFIRVKKRIDDETKKLIDTKYDLFRDRTIRFGGKPREASWEEKEYLKMLNRDATEDFT